MPGCVLHVTLYSTKGRCSDTAQNPLETAGRDHRPHDRARRVRPRHRRPRGRCRAAARDAGHHENAGQAGPGVRRGGGEGRQTRRHTAGRGRKGPDRRSGERPQGTRWCRPVHRREAGLRQGFDPGRQRREGRAAEDRRRGRRRRDHPARRPEARGRDHPAPAAGARQGHPARQPVPAHRRHLRRAVRPGLQELGRQGHHRRGARHRGRPRLRPSCHDQPR